MAAANNIPDYHEAVVLPDDKEKVTVEIDRKVSNAVTITFEREDHTIGNLLRMQLLRDPTVSFVGYRLPHPLQYHVQLRVQVTPPTTDDSAPVEDGQDLPVEAVKRAMEDLKAEISLLDERFNKALQAKRGTAATGGYPSYG